MLKNLSIVLLAASTLLLADCRRVPVTGRSQFNLIPESQLTSLANSEYDVFLAQSQVVTSTPDAQKVKTVGSRLSNAVEKFLRDQGQADEIKQYAWEYNLIQSDQVNAWCMPGGKIAFYTGIMPVCKDEPGVATVMGHEIAHAVARHGNERMSQSLAVQLGGAALDIALSQKPAETRNLFLTAYGVGANVGVLLPFSRKQESEADKLGLIFMSMAGYQPDAAVDFWKRMSALGGAAPPEFLSTHPSNERRIKDIQNYLPKAREYYAQP